MQIDKKSFRRCSIVRRYAREVAYSFKEHPYYTFGTHSSVVLTRITRQSLHAVSAISIKNLPEQRVSALVTVYYNLHHYSSITKIKAMVKPL